MLITMVTRIMMRSAVSISADESPKTLVIAIVMKEPTL